jgi:hypothetical protein
MEINLQNTNTFYTVTKMIEVTQEPDGSMTIDWDPNDPVESIMNDWTADDFIQALQEYLEQLKTDKLV